MAEHVSGDQKLKFFNNADLSDCAKIHLKLFL